MSDGKMLMLNLDGATQAKTAGARAACLGWQAQRRGAPAHARASSSARGSPAPAQACRAVSRARDVADERGRLESQVKAFVFAPHACVLHERGAVRLSHRPFRGDG